MVTLSGFQRGQQPSFVYIMTRINCGVQPSELTRQHLLAEAREIKRIPNAVKSGKAKVKNIPETFRLGTGHVKFFYDKLGYLLNRYKQIHKECKSRGYNVQDFSSAWSGVPKVYMNDYKPSKKDREIVLRRIKNRLVVFGGGNVEDADGQPQKQDELVS